VNNALLKKETIMEVSSNSYSNFVFSEEEKKLIRDHVKDNLQNDQKHLANENTANTVEKNIVYVIQEWNHLVAEKISTYKKSLKITYSFCMRSRGNPFVPVPVPVSVPDLLPGRIFFNRKSFGTLSSCPINI